MQFKKTKNQNQPTWFWDSYNAYVFFKNKSVQNIKQNIFQPVNKKLFIKNNFKHKSKLINLGSNGLEPLTSFV